MKIDFKYKTKTEAIASVSDMQKCKICMNDTVIIAINGVDTIVRCPKCSKSMTDKVSGEGVVRMKWLTEQMVEVWNSSNEPIEYVDVDNLRDESEKHRGLAEDYEAKAKYFESGQGGNEWTLEFDSQKIEQGVYIRFFSQSRYGNPAIHYGWIGKTLSDNALRYSVKYDDRFGRGEDVPPENITAIAILPPGKNRPEYRI